MRIVLATSKPDYPLSASGCSLAKMKAKIFGIYINFRAHKKKREREKNKSAKSECEI